MNYTAFVCFLEAFADFNPILQKLIERQGSFAEAVGQCLAFQILHDKVAGAVVDSDIV